MNSENLIVFSKQLDMNLRNRRLFFQLSFFLGYQTSFDYFTFFLSKHLSNALVLFTWIVHHTTAFWYYKEIDYGKNLNIQLRNFCNEREMISWRK